MCAELSCDVAHSRNTVMVIVCKHALVQLSGNPYAVYSIVWFVKTRASPAPHWRGNEPCAAPERRTRLDVGRGHRSLGAVSRADVWGTVSRRTAAACASTGEHRLRRCTAREGWTSPPKTG